MLKYNTANKSQPKTKVRVLVP